MARSHSLSAAAAWLVAAAGSASLGAPWSVHAVTIGAVVVAGSAILPDIDCPGSHAARSLGPATGLVARAAAAGSRTIYRRTAGPVDRPDTRDGHRGVTHTVAFAVLAGALVSGAAYLPGGRWAAGAVLFFTTALAARALLTWKARHVRAGGVRWEWAPLAAAAAAAVLLELTPHATSWAWLGIPVTMGCAIHDLGDAPTHHPDANPANGGIPLLWPIKIRGQRWYRCRPHVAVMFPVGGVLEAAAALAFALTGAGALLWMAW